MNKNAFTTPGNLVADAMFSGAGLSAGAQGQSLPMSEPTGTASYLAVANLRKEMAPFYQVAAQMRKQEADRLLMSVFKKQPTGVGGAAARLAAEILATQSYARRIEPYLVAMEKELLEEGVGIPSSEFPEDTRRVLDTRKQEVLARQADRFSKYLERQGYQVAAGGGVIGPSGYSGDTPIGRHLDMWRDVVEQ